MRHRQDSESHGNAADSGEPGKRVVIVGGGWAGKQLCDHFPVDQCSHPESLQAVSCITQGECTSTRTVHAAGFGAAKHLSQQGYSVTVLDASPDPGGLSAGWRTEQGRAVEAGVKGFWYQVRRDNILDHHLAMILVQ